MNGKYELFVDGACRGNPGPAGIGVVLKRDGEVIKEIAWSIGNGTNNIAEYSALIRGLEEAVVDGIQAVDVYTDSELLFRQVTGTYKIKNETLKFLHDQVITLARGFKNFHIQHIPREQNRHADKLATQVLKMKQTTVVASLFDDSGEESPSSAG